MASLRPYFILCRVSNLPTVWANVIAAWFLAGGVWQVSLAAAALAASLCYCGGMILNDVCDASWDRHHGKPRPIPRGEIHPRTAAWLAWTHLGLGAGSLLLLGSSPVWTAAMLASIVAYNHLHKHWTGSVWLMAACRFFLFLTVASLLPRPLPAPVWLWGSALACYVAGITLAARHEDTHGRVHPLAWACLFAPLLAALASLPPAPPRLASSAVLLAAFACWLARAYGRLRAGQASTGRFVGLLLAGMVLVDALALSGTAPLPSALCLLLLPLNLFLQAFVPPT